MMTRKARRILIIIPIVIIVILMFATCVFLYLTTDMFKSARTLFFKYIGENSKNIGLVQEIYIDQKSEELQTKKYIENCEVKLNYAKNAGTSSENMNNSINDLKFIIDSEVDKTNKYEYQNVRILNKDDRVLGLEYVNDGDIYGIKFPDLFKQYILTQKNDFKGLLKKIGYNEDEKLENIPDSINISQSILSEVTFTDEEIENLKNKYLNLFINDFSGDKFKKIQRQNITINDKKVEVDGYMLKLTKEQLNNIYIKILEELKKDEIVLEKIQKLQDKVKIINQISTENVDLKEKFVSKIEDTISEINQNNIGNEETSIIVYENQGKTVRTSISGVDYELNFDVLQPGEETYAQISKKKIESENYEFLAKIEGTKNKFNVELEDSEEDRPYKISVQKNINEEDEKNKENTSIIYENATSKIEATILEDTEFVDDFNNKPLLNGESSIQLDDLNEENLEGISNKIQEAVVNRINFVKQEVIKTDDINEILEEFGLYHTTKRLQGSGISETEKNRFNSKFELLQGENLENDVVTGTIDTIKENIINVNATSGQELKLEIARNEGNTELGEKIKKYIDEKKDEKYDISVEYDEAGIVKYVVIKIANDT